MRAHSQNDRVPTELEIEGGYLSIVDGTASTSTYNEASAEALVDPACGGHRRNWLKPGLGDQHGYPLDTYSESRRTVRPSTARTTVRAIRLLMASKGSSV